MEQQRFEGGRPIQLAGQDTPCTMVDADSQVTAARRIADFGGRYAARIRLCVDGQM